MRMANDYSSRQMVFDFSAKASRLYHIKEYIENKFFISTYVRHNKLIINPDGCNPKQLSDVAEYFLKSGSEYILKLNDYSQVILIIDQIRIYLSTNTNTLLELNSDMLSIYGSAFNVTCVYNYIYQLQKSISDAEIKKFTKSQKNFIKSKKDDLNIHNLELTGKTKHFFFVLFNGINCLFNQIEGINIDALSLEVSSTPFQDDTNQIDISNNEQTEIGENNISDNPPSLTSLKNFNPDSPYRPIYIDGQNVAFEHSKHTMFSARGIKLAFDHFMKRGFTEVYVMVPRHYQGRDSDEILSEMEKTKKLSYTPSRKFNNKRETAYDDRLILDAALASDGVVVSNDQFRDLALEDGKYVDIIENRLLPYVFVGDIFLIPEDPRGKNGPKADDILRKIPRQSNENEVSFQTNQKRSNHAPVNAPNNMSNRTKKAKAFDKVCHERSRSNKAHCSNFYSNYRSHSNTGEARSSNFTGKKHNDNYPLNHQQQKMYDRIKDVLPEEQYRNDIRRVILDNPKLKDADALFNLIILQNNL